MKLLSVGGGSLAVERDLPRRGGNAFMEPDYTSVRERVNQSLRV